MDFSERHHQRGVDYLVCRLTNKHFDAIFKNVPYKISYQGHTYEGEIDVLAVRNNYFHAYEVKSHYSSKTLHHAKEQLSRFSMAFPNIHLKKIYFAINKGILKLHN